MLYDKRWDIKADPFTLEDFVAWLETMPPKGRYDFECMDGTCLMAQYMAARGRAWTMYAYSESCWQVFGDEGYVLVIKPWTFGAALKRARAMLAERAALSAEAAERHQGE